MTRNQCFLFGDVGMWAREVTRHHFVFHSFIHSILHCQTGDSVFPHTYPGEHHSYFLFSF